MLLMRESILRTARRLAEECGRDLAWELTAARKVVIWSGKDETSWLL